MPDPRRPVAIDLFSGAGGLSLGFEQAGFDVLASVEYDPIHAAVHAFNFPKTSVICADITTVSADRLRTAAEAGWKAHDRAGDWDGEIDAIIGGPPCQGFSLIGKRNFDDTRNQLVFNFARLVGELRPRYFVMENVQGMTSLAASAEADAPRLLDLLLEEFRGYGYTVPEYQTLNASEWGVPQDRRRLILMGARDGQGDVSHPTPTTRPRSRRPKATAQEPPGTDEKPLCPSVSEAIDDLPNLDDFEVLKYGDEAVLTAAELEQMTSKASSYVRRLRGCEADPTDLSWPRRWEPSLLTSSYRTCHDPKVVARFKATSVGHPEPVSRLFRLHPDGVSSTLRAGTHYERGSFNAPRPLHPKHPRVISVREAARLHSFPDWFRLHWTKWHGFRQVGNSLPPLVGRAIGKQIVTALNVSPSKPTSVIELGDVQLLMLENLEAAARFGADPERMPRNALRARKEPPRQTPDAEAA